jgi:hypothetical protein
MRARYKSNTLLFCLTNIIKAIKKCGGSESIFIIRFEAIAKGYRFKSYQI